MIETPSVKSDSESVFEETLRGVIGGELLANEPMRRHTTLKVGGPARWFWGAKDTETLARVLAACWEKDIPYLFVGHGSNLLMSDSGYNGLVIQNRCKRTEIGETTYSDSGVSLGSLFNQAARAGYSGLEWAIGIPGTVGGALVSNAGAYRGNIGPLVQTIRVFHEGQDQVVGADWMEFSYRDSRLRRSGGGRTVLLSCTLLLPYEGDPEAIMARAREFQAQRRSKQPYAPSAGSFFKNVYDHALAESLPNLPRAMKDAGVVPAGYLIEACDLKGAREGFAQVSEKHANFLINLDNQATATELHQLAARVKAEVCKRFGVTLEEEVLYVGDWG